MVYAIVFKYTADSNHGSETATVIFLKSDRLDRL